MGNYIVCNNELYHHGVPGQRWGVRRYQNEDGSLTPEGEKRYSESLSKAYDDGNEDDDYTLPKGTSIFRRTQSDKDTDLSDEKYTYGYDYDDSKDDSFYKQFGKKITEYTLADDTTLAGKKSLGKAFAEKMLSINDENDIEALDLIYSDNRSRLGKDYVEGLFSVPFEPSKHMQELERAGADMVSRMLATQRHEGLDAKLRKRGIRDFETAANDIGRSIVENLLSDGYSGIRDYNDYGSAANVNTPTVIFDPNTTLKKLKSWIED